MSRKSLGVFARKRAVKVFLGQSVQSALSNLQSDVLSQLANIKPVI